MHGPLVAIDEPYNYLRGLSGFVEASPDISRMLAQALLLVFPGTSGSFKQISAHKAGLAISELSKSVP